MRRFNLTNFLRWLPLAAVLVGMYLPVVMTAIYSFNASRIGTVWTGFSLQGYVRLWEQGDLWQGLAASCLIGSLASTLAVTFGTLAALGLRRWKARPRAAARGLLTLPLVTPDVIIALSLAMFFNALRVEQGWTTVVLAHGVFSIAYAFVVMSGAVDDLDDTLFAAALDCGATPWQAYRRVIVPILAPSLVVAWLFVFALSFDDFLITFLTKGPGADTLPIKIYAQMRFGIRPETNALFVVLFLVTLGGSLAAQRLARVRDMV
ncbi:MAG: ABC transporter permease [Pirellulaceae bacterium]|nr:ABC transporter permease [Pirellulaceae bacterium]